MDDDERVVSGEEKEELDNSLKGKGGPSRYKKAASWSRTSFWVCEVVPRCQPHSSELAALLEGTAAASDGRLHDVRVGLYKYAQDAECRASHLTLDNVMPQDARSMQVHGESVTSVGRPPTPGPVSRSVLGDLTRAPLIVTSIRPGLPPPPSTPGAYLHQSGNIITQWHSDAQP
jgi:hypothetical protein